MINGLMYFIFIIISLNVIKFMIREFKTFSSKQMTYHLIKKYFCKKKIKYP